MSNCIEDELRALLNEPIASKVLRDQARADLLMIQVERALAPHFNAMLADLAKEIRQNTLGPTGGAGQKGEQDDG